MYKLIIEDDEGKTTVVPLIRDEITIGRKEGNTIRLTERNVSRKHARLVRQNSSVFIEDLSSYNGIRINGSRIAGRSPVGEGDRVQIGDYQLALKSDKAAAGVPSGDLHEQHTTPFVRDGVPTAPQDVTATVQTPGPPAAMQADAPGRLFVVSSNFAGQEFVLDKAAMVIGRTDENDIVINHRSISRHHAKVVREGGHYHVVDLQSANGVRVNGEEYGKVELRRGDHIDLGHVRLRFVAPGEDFVFERDAQIVDVGGGKGSRGLVVAGIAAAVVALAVVLLVALKPSGGGPGTGQTAGGKPSEAAELEVARLLLDADKAMRAENWDVAIARCDEALKHDPSSEVARDKRSRAEAERRSGQSYKNFVTFADRGDLDSAVASYGEIAEDSLYRPKGADRYANVRRSYVRAHLDAARAAKKTGNCEEAHQHVEAALTVDESNAEAQEIVRSCETRVAAAAPRPARPTEPARPRAVARAERPSEPSEPKQTEPKQTEPRAESPVAKRPDPEDKPEPSAPNPQIDKLLQDAQDKYVHGQYASAIEDAKHAVKAQPSKAWRIIGASQCFLKNREGAVQAWNKLDAQGRQFLKYVCSRNQVTVP